MRRSWTLPGIPSCPGGADTRAGARSRRPRPRRRRKAGRRTRRETCPAASREASRGIRFDSGERSSVETCSPSARQQDDLPLGHTQDRERFARDEAERVVVPPVRRIGERHAVRVEPQRPVPGPQVQRLLDRQLVDDDRRAVCGPRRVDRVAQRRGREADGAPGRFGRAVRRCPLRRRGRSPSMRRPRSNLAIAAGEVVSPMGRDQDRHLRVVARSRPRGPRQRRRRASASARRARAAVARRSAHARARASGASRSSSGRAAAKGSPRAPARRRAPAPSGLPRAGRGRGSWRRRGGSSAR